MQSKTKISSARFARAAVVAAAVAFLAACGSDSTAPRNASVAGTYGLTTVNGASLPYTVPNTTGTEIVQDATITLNTDSTYSVLANGTVNGSTSTIAADAGHYTVGGSQVTFTSTIFSGGQFTGNVTGSTLSATIPGAFVGSRDVSFTLVFAKAS